MKWFKGLLLMMLLSLIFVSSSEAKSRKAWLFDLPSGKLCEMPVVLIDPAAPSATAYKNTAISTTTLTAAVTTFTLANADFTDIIHPRNIVAVIDFASGTSTTTVVGTLVVTGTNARGIATTETLNISTTSATGNVAWRTISSMVLTVTGISGREAAENANVKVGSGAKFGLPNDVISASDIHKVIEAGALTTTYTLNTTYDTISFVNAANGSRDYEIWTKVSQW